MVSSVENVAGKAYDYVVIGGGTAGLTAASRLVEYFPDRSVLILEAGESNLDDPKILLGGQFGSTFGDPKYDWIFTTKPQKHHYDKVMTWNRGKGLGGSSGMNFYVWTKPPKESIDAFEELGNPGWNWKSYQELTMRAEDFTEATEDQLKELVHTYKAEYRGRGGPIKTTVPATAVSLTKGFLDSLQNMGVRLLDDPYGGDITGCWQAAVSLNREAQWTRSYAATAYYLPNKDKPNFTVLTEANVARILLDGEESSGGVIATGVEFTHGGKTYSVKVNKEVVVSAGTIKSPQVLELSGIGRRDVLETAGIPVKVELPGVGENVQDHTLCAISYELDPKTGPKTFDVLRNPKLAEEQAKLQKAGADNLYRYGISAYSFLPIQTMNPNGAPEIIEGVSKLVEEQIKSGKLPPGLAEQYKIQLRTLKDAHVPDLEVIDVNCFMSHRSAPEDGKAYITILAVLQNPFSRGTIHIKSKDPLEQPDIDPALFENPYDLELLKESVKYTKRMAETEPFKSLVTKEVDPGKENSTDDEIREYLRNYAHTCWHAIASNSMLPRDKNGVVDPNLKVYGTKNVRVADLSVLPLHIASHTQSAAYYVGEKVADILKSA
ncbi:GMC oxidoreductase [Daedalea quercina L-15889]|uniref:GMC oxidoreductase n=1 Tax=Daedalea quercina L-15889 TaxID=1314783 RepID=A0A165MYX7_9APHY|nr:GMC oxidoreductase [Daedalea quercina L-15889]